MIKKIFKNYHPTQEIKNLFYVRNPDSLFNG